MWKKKKIFFKNYTLEVKWYKNNCKNDVNGGVSANIMAVKLVHKEPESSYLKCSLQFYLTNGTLMVQGNGYKDWGRDHLPLLLKSVEEYVDYTKKLIINTNTDKGCDSELPENTAKDNMEDSTKTLKDTNTADKSKMKKILQNRAQRIASERENEVIDLGTGLESSVVNVNNRFDSLQQETKDADVKINRQVKTISKYITSVNIRTYEIVNTLIEIKQIQFKILEEVEILKKKDKSKTTVELPKEHKDAIDEVHATLKALQDQVLDIGSVKPSVNVDIPVVDLLNDNERMDTNECDAYTTVDNNGQVQSQIITI